MKTSTSRDALSTGLSTATKAILSLSRTHSSAPGLASPALQFCQPSHIGKTWRQIPGAQPARRKYASTIHLTLAAIPPQLLPRSTVIKAAPPRQGQSAQHFRGFAIQFPSYAARLKAAGRAHTHTHTHSLALSSALRTTHSAPSSSPRPNPLPTLSGCCCCCSAGLDAHTALVHI